MPHSIPCIQSHSGSDSVTQDHDVTPQGEFQEVDGSLVIKLSQEIADLKLKAAIAMQEALDAKCEILNMKNSRLGDSSGMTIRMMTEEGRCSNKSSVYSENQPVPSEGALERLLLRLELPKCELPTFDGRPIEYTLFLRQFEDQIESRVLDEGQRLMYLYRCCTGKARKAIDGCLMYPAEEGYNRARRILHDLFGQRYMVVRAALESITEPGMIRNDPEDLTSFSNQLTTCADTLEQLNYLADLNSFSTLSAVIEKLPRFMIPEWVKRADEIYQSGREPSFRDLCDFIAIKARLSRNRFNILNKTQMVRDVNHKYSANIRVVRTGNAVNKEPCIICEEQHVIEKCDLFNTMPHQQRWSVAVKNNLCFTCLKRGHSSKTCRWTSMCGVKGCGESHHSLLHRDKPHESTNLSCDINIGNVYMGIIPVNLVSNQTSVCTYALLDSGSDTTLVSQSLVQQLGLEGEDVELNIGTITGNQRKQSTVVSLMIQSMDGAENISIPRAFSVPRISSRQVSLPDINKIKKWEHLQGIEFGEPVTRDIGLLIGLDVPEAHWITEQRRGKRKTPHADKTPLGWVLRGPASESDGYASINLISIEADDIENNIEKLYNNEFGDTTEVGLGMSREEQNAVKIVERSLSLRNGHFCIALPWKTNRDSVNCQSRMAMCRLNQLKKRLDRDDELKQRYTSVIQRYVEEGFAVEVNNVANRNDYTPRWYLPHHAVVNKKKPGKMRVVFDCAAKVDGKSLNTHLYQGPDMLLKLVGVLLRFRAGAYAVCADIKDMYMQVRVPKRDQGALRFFWWPNGETSMEAREYQLTVHPFGAISSPFCANFALRKVASLVGDDSERIEKLVKQCFYVDDLLMSGDHLDEVISCAESLKEALAKAGFRLTKWVSNSRAMLVSVPEQDRADSVKDLDLEPSSIERTLGLTWEILSDSLGYNATNHDSRLTKRAILSQIASIYDPLGLICPLILPAKILLQTLCREKCGWDDSIDAQVAKQWIQWRRDMELIANVRIPRWYGISTDSVRDVELHVFCDASEQGYGAVAYLRHNDERAVKCCILFAKSRVAPLKTVSLPRLELAAAVSASKIAILMKKELEGRFHHVYMWTDSMIVLYYLKNRKRRFATYVANRVSKILDATSHAQWLHVPGSLNPADMASRGITIKSDQFSIWTEGPIFLRDKDWQAPPDFPPTVSESEIEIKRDRFVNVVQRTVEYWAPFAHFSDWNKLVRCVAWLLRFKEYIIIMRGKSSKGYLRVGPLSLGEVRTSIKSIVRLVQESVFREDIERILSHPNNQCRKQSSLRKLSPVLLDGILSVGGRLQWCCWENSAKHPMILPSRHPVTDMVIRNQHELEGHAGSAQVTAATRRKFWILQGGVAARRVINSCIRCKRQTVRPCHQIMAPLPIARISHNSCAFSTVGIDYFGPIYVKRGRVEEKRYGCLFTCMNIRAIHIEVAHNLSTDSFIQALTRFMSRRGQPDVIYSDNGSNFRGAHAELNRCIQTWSIDHIRNHLMSRDVKWVFGPPETSHWGGIWERMIRSIRKTLNTLTIGQRITDENLVTFLCEVERAINGRPLVPVDDDPKGLEVLTPNQLLILRDHSNVSDSWDFAEHCIRTWRRLQVLSTTFWKRWRHEYLSLLQLRHKWFLNGRNLQIDDVVLVRNEWTGRNQWPLGRVIAVHPGLDDRVREVTVRTALGSEKRRDVRKLCLLEGVN